MSARITAISCALLLVIAAAPAQVRWQRRGVSLPEGVCVVAHAMAYDQRRAETVAFGGGYGATWVWDGTRWRTRAVSTSPGVRSYHAMVYDAVGGVTVMFGGLVGLTTLGDTWLWNGSDWSRPATAVRPAARYGHALAYDAARGVTVLFGGTDSTTLFADTWEWNGSTWSLRNPAVSPSPRVGHAMAYDTARRRMVLFGGTTSTPGCPPQCPPLRDTWEWDGTTWQQRAPASSPQARADAAMAYHEARQRIVMFGGSGPRQLGDTWEWDGTRWASRGAGPSARTNSAMVYDSARRRLVLTAGYGCGIPQCFPLCDTWEYFSTAPASYTALGAGCPGSGGTPALTPVGSLPWREDDLVLSLGPIAPSPAIAAVGIVGASRAQWGPLALPVGLGFLGAPGCSLLTGAEVVVPLTVQAGAAAWRLPIPATLMAGQQFHLQGLLLGDPVNPGMLVTSDAGQAVVGSR